MSKLKSFKKRYDKELKKSDTMVIPLRLKTLKDLKEESSKFMCSYCEGEMDKDWSCGSPDDHLIELLEELKQMAIKWIKAGNALPFGTFAEFHNITAEDLK